MKWKQKWNLFAFVSILRHTTVWYYNKTSLTWLNSPVMVWFYAQAKHPPASELVQKLSLSSKVVKSDSKMITKIYRRYKRINGRLFLSLFWPLLKQASVFEATGILVKIGSSLKLVLPSLSKMHSMLVKNVRTKLIKILWLKKD